MLNNVRLVEFESVIFMAAYIELRDAQSTKMLIGKLFGQ